MVPAEPGWRVVLKYDDDLLEWPVIAWKEAGDLIRAVYVHEVTFGDVLDALAVEDEHDHVVAYLPPDRTLSDLIDTLRQAGVKI